ncbi:hypothetical protein D1AOALGA4SA_4323 [Olavius algarvensis Delta 1 endosymbiont]|nr:hypothetical protein D1AOALGA4SA_4323 [Olavius algarvensis Delta 1 endosymbiont]
MILKKPDRFLYITDNRKIKPDPKPFQFMQFKRVRAVDTI